MQTLWIMYQGFSQWSSCAAPGGGTLQSRGTSTASTGSSSNNRKSCRMQTQVSRHTAVSKHRMRPEQRRPSKNGARQSKHAQYLGFKLLRVICRRCIALDAAAMMRMQRAHKNSTALVLQ